MGQPNESSPVLVTCNYTLTVSQVLHRLRGLDVWLLVANSNGINVWCAACGAALALAVGFDLAGIAGPMPSDVEAFLERLGITSLGFLLSEKTTGTIVQDRDACSGCRNCHDLCPVGVYDLGLTDKKTVLARLDECFSCGACVKQCPENALSLTCAD